MKPEEQMPFLAKHCDPAMIRAVLTAPAWLSGLSDTAYAYVRTALEKQAPPEVLAERDFVMDALAEVERGYQAHQTDAPLCV
jgi:hypothetical protein